MKKLCNKCNIETDRYKDGRCKSCAKIRRDKFRLNNPDYGKEWVKNNKERHKNLCREWYKNNISKALEYAKKWQKDNPERRSAINRRLREKNPEKHKASYTKWKSLNKDRVSLTASKWQKENSIYCRSMSSRRRSIKKNSEGSYNLRDINKLLQDQTYKCNFCFISIKKKYHVDHVIPLSKGGSNWPSNLQLLCPTCNLRKGAKDPIQFANENGRLF